MATTEKLLFNGCRPSSSHAYQHWNLRRFAGRASLTHDIACKSLPCVFARLGLPPLDEDRGHRVFVAGLAASREAMFTEFKVA